MSDPQQPPGQAARLDGGQSVPPQPTESYTLFRETTRRYREDYERLEAQFESLNVRLEETNRELRRSLEDKARLSSFLNDVLESLTGGVIVVDADGVITLFNRAAEQITGRSHQEAVGRPYAEAMGPVDEGQNTALHALATGGGHRNAGKQLCHPDGRVIPLSFSTSLVRDEAGAVLGAVEVFYDMTEVRRLEAQVQRAHTLAALGEMAATVAHEVRNPLGGIATYAGLLRRDLADGDARRALVDKIAEGVGRLDRIVTGLLSYTHPVHVELRPVDLAQLVEETTAFFETDLARRRDDVRLERVYPAAALLCRVDPEQFQQVVLNLLRNAVQAMPQGGCVAVSVAAAGEGPGAVVVVRDTGAGIPDHILRKLFTPFFTTKADGTGLGLVTSRRIVEAHGGQIHVESDPGAGTSFIVTLPG